MTIAEKHVHTCLSDRAFFALIFSSRFLGFNGKIKCAYTIWFLFQS